MEILVINLSYYILYIEFGFSNGWLSDEYMVLFECFLRLVGVNNCLNGLYVFLLVLFFFVF